jgi:cell division protein FtsZ
MSTQVYEAIVDSAPLSLQLVEVGDGPGEAAGNRFGAAPPATEDVADLNIELGAYERRLSAYQLGYLRLSVDGEEVAVFSPRDTACEPFKVPTTASFIEVTGEDHDYELLLAAFPLTHLDPARCHVHRMSAPCGRQHTISLNVSPLPDEGEGIASFWVVQVECGVSEPRPEEALRYAEQSVLIAESVDNLLAFPRPGGLLPQPNTNPLVRIVVVGIGSSGGNTVDKMIGEGVRGVTYAVLNTDLQALQLSRAPIKVQLGPKVARGLGAGSNPEVGRAAAIESTEKIAEVLGGADMVLITTGMGGGTGTGAAPMVARLAKEMGALTVGVVTTPFPFEGRKRARQAEQGLDFLCERSDTVFTLPNERLLHTLYKGVSFRQALAATDDVVRRGVQSILELVASPGLVNLDFAVVRAVMAGMGSAFLGTGSSSGEMRALEAMHQAISSPLLGEATIQGAKGVLINITGGSDLTLYEVNEASSIIRESADDDANIIFGAVIDENLRDEMKVTIIAAGQRSFGSLGPQGLIYA